MTGRQFLALVGPPAVGKSTMSEFLAADFGAGVFRLREFAQFCRNHGVLASGLFETSDRLGWFSDGTVDAVLHAAFVDDLFNAQGLVVLEGLPGSADQLRLVMKIASGPLAVVEMVADDTALLARVAARRVCVSCEPNPHDDPHLPAVASTQHHDRCDRCGHRLRRRRGDDSTRFGDRLKRFRHHIPGIRGEAMAANVPYHTINNTTATDGYLALRSAVRALGVLEIPAPLSISPGSFHGSNPSARTGHLDELSLGPRRL